MMVDLRLSDMNKLPLGAMELLHAELDDMSAFTPDRVAAALASALSSRAAAGKSDIARLEVEQSTYMDSA
eukprot:2553983-Heterocapsa_arctica.AAC.1